MTFVRTPLTDLEDAATKYATDPAYKIPQLDPSTGKVQQWLSITFREFKKDVDTYAKYWANVLRSVPQRSVVGVWVAGLSYADVALVYGLSRAGYIPQLFSLRLPSPEIIYELLQKAGAKALVYDSSSVTDVKDCPVPAHLAVNAEEAGKVSGDIPPFPTVASEEDTAFIYHTSGSTSGSPKLVPWTYSFINFLHHKALQVIPFQEPKRVVTWTGSICHAAQSMIVVCFISQGGCIIQPTTINFTSEELVDMARRANLNTINQFPTYLATHLRRARKDPEILALLQSMDEIVYGGLALPADDRDWARKNGIKLKDVFGNTECAILMISVGGAGPHASLLRPVDGPSFEFRPIESKNDSESGHQSSTKFVELIVLANSLDCPHPPLLKPDGNFHTGDLFEEVVPGLYANRGRDDDWIKSENALRCDTRAIEDNVRATCGDLIKECVVVGYGRPSPTLFVEAPTTADEAELKKEIIRATRPFNSRRYVHERIVSEKMIVVVPPNSLPRTGSKGNIRRKAVEEEYKTRLDEIYAQA